jgi:hypothetical protein
MIDSNECPECSSVNTKRVHTEWLRDCVEETRVSTKCPTQYTVGYANPTVHNVTVVGETQ